MEYAQAHPEEINKVAKVQSQVSEVKSIMMENIEKVLDRGEKLEMLVDKTENLRYQADQFQKSGKALRNKMWWQNIKMKLLVALILAIVVVVIFCFACFSGNRNCTKHGGRRHLLTQAAMQGNRRMLAMAGAVGQQAAALPLLAHAYLLR
jgi:hypothetical protein